MAKKKSQVEIYQMVCEECGERNYITSLKRDHKGMQRKKFCPVDRKHTNHKAKKA